MNLGIPPTDVPENHVFEGGFQITVPPPNAVEIPIPVSPTRTIPKGHDSYQGIPGDGVVPG